MEELLNKLELLHIIEGINLKEVNIDNVTDIIEAKEKTRVIA